MWRGGESFLGNQGYSGVAFSGEGEGVFIYLTTSRTRAGLLAQLSLLSAYCEKHAQLSTATPVYEITRGMDLTLIVWRMHGCASEIQIDAVCFYDISIYRPNLVHFLTYPDYFHDIIKRYEKWNRHPSAS